MKYVEEEKHAEARKAAGIYSLSATGAFARLAADVGQSTWHSV